MQQLFNFDNLAILSITLILFISIIVGKYSKKYLQTDKNRNIFLILIYLIAISLIITFSTDNIIIIGLFWLISNLLLVLLMIHKPQWKQAKSSGLIALKNFLIGSLSLIFALIILYLQSKSYKISEIINHNNIDKVALFSSCCLILIAALSQSALYPFHSWIISSLNSPTPASALMHAGLVNGGGIILARFSPLFFKIPIILDLLFIIAIISILIGTIWKLIQSNVKAMLACSTMSQMGFMVAQCSMGLFPAAIAHLFWHGMFKSYLFLSSPVIWQEKRFNLSYLPCKISFILSLLCGICGAAIFAKINHIEITKWQTDIVLLVICFIAITQLALTIIGQNILKKFIPAFVLSSFASLIYASSVNFIEKLMPSYLYNPQNLNLYHIMAMIIFFVMWLLCLLLKGSNKIDRSFLNKYYVKFLNSSQPRQETITSNRNQYRYK